jgi:hypothetical protein
MYIDVLFIDVTKFSRLSKLSNIHVHFVDIRAIVDHKLFKLSIYKTSAVLLIYTVNTGKTLDSDTGKKKQST